jgi:hypothetical protein
MQVAFNAKSKWQPVRIPMRFAFGPVRVENAPLELKFTTRRTGSKTQTTTIEQG